MLSAFISWTSSFLFSLPWMPLCSLSGLCCLLFVVPFQPSVSCSNTAKKMYPGSCQSPAHVWHGHLQFLDAVLGSRSFWNLRMWPCLEIELLCYGLRWDHTGVGRTGVLMRREETHRETQHVTMEAETCQIMSASEERHRLTATVEAGRGA